MQPAAYRTYSIRQPKVGHAEPITCTQAGCSAHQFGWTSLIDEATELGQRQAHYIRKLAGRMFTEQRDGPLTMFVFPPGEECFEQHRPHWFGIRAGARPGWQVEANQWVDDFGNHLDHLRVERG